jgi:NAD(P)-dependent dehydrogenase (short-subunit alcohol dehydrogenase family)
LGRPRRITLMAICTIHVRTQMAERRLDAPRMADGLLHDVLPGRFGQPREVARLARFLLSPVFGPLTGG